MRSNLSIRKKNIRKRGQNRVCNLVDLSNSIKDSLYRFRPARITMLTKSLCGSNKIVKITIWEDLKELHKDMYLNPSLTKLEFQPEIQIKKIIIAMGWAARCLVKTTMVLPNLQANKTVNKCFPTLISRWQMARITWCSPESNKTTPQSRSKWSKLIKSLFKIIIIKRAEASLTWIKSKCSRWIPDLIMLVFYQVEAVF